VSWGAYGGGGINGGDGGDDGGGGGGGGGGIHLHTRNMSTVLVPTKEGGEPHVTYTPSKAQPPKMFALECNSIERWMPGSPEATRES